MVFKCTFPPSRREHLPGNDRSVRLAHRLGPVFGLVKRLCSLLRSASLQTQLREKLKGLEGVINENILGQPEVVREMVPILINGELGINSQGKPKANLLLLGPPGVGKTEVCNAFTDYLLGSDKLVRFE
jgi:ATP-dependent Clp protease ATP-binding subunit ClpA